MSNFNSSQHETEALRKDVGRRFLDFARSFWAFIKKIMQIREGTDIASAIEGIKRDIDFKGHNVWILICSIFIASIGLNTNSTAVIIGAMLISPLMGPILGVGLSVGTNDLTTLVRSLKSFGVAVGVSLLTSTLYFLITPLTEAQPELIARTRPTSLDILIAFFGGMAGIIAGSRKEINNVIPGVAIATALMPPLCTAGYGLAIGNMPFFFGAFYLFLLNSVFICIATVVIVRYLGFPVVHGVDPLKGKKVKRYIILFTLIVIIPSAFLFWEIIKESWFRTKAEKFITESIVFEGSSLVNKKLTFNDTLSVIDLYMIGELVTDKQERELSRKLSNFGLKKTVLKIHQAKDITGEITGKLSMEVRTGIIEDIYKRNEELMRQKEDRIVLLENKLNQLQKDSLLFASLQREVKIQYSGLEKFGYGHTVETDFKGRDDTVSVFMVKWNSSISSNNRKKQQEQLLQWLKVRLQRENIRVINY